MSSEDENYSVAKVSSGYPDLRTVLTIVSSISLFCTISCVVVFFILLSYNAHRVNIPLVKITMSIQSVHAVALIITIVLNIVSITSEVLCSSLRYILYICYLVSIFMCCAITIHLWLVISRRKLNQTKRNERWYYIISYVLAIILSAALAIIPNSAFKLVNRCMVASIPSPQYLGIRWALYYSWFVVASLISIICMISVLRSAQRLSHTTHTHGREYTSTTEAYRSAVNARANGKRLRSLMFYTIAYPVISLVCNLPQLLQELLATTMKKELTGLNFAARLLLCSEGTFLALAFFLYPAVLHSIRDITYSAVQYWVVEQEVFWRRKQNDIKNFHNGRMLHENPNDMMVDKTDLKNFTSTRGRIFHSILLKTGEGKRATTLS
ncbi:hypothetical protein LPJ66_004199 [Kickxella alabastrina]|uniref:Uncharacterized protein n=1 Tax=Kickxella alabastrina TaxID=61397 RepID=A0ACC1ILX9_9FUNG|nr:hypothetical protein LPJ66_004199 [Kickxella alabastrina]